MVYFGRKTYPRNRTKEKVFAKFGRQSVEHCNQLQNAGTALSPKHESTSIQENKERNVYFTTVQ